MVNHRLETRTWPTHTWPLRSLLTPVAAPRPRRAPAWCAVAVLALVAGCTAGSDENRPPKAQFFFPSGLAASPDGKALFVGNGNSILEYDSGSVMVVNLETVQTTLTQWLGSDRTAADAPADCDIDQAFDNLLQCDESTFINGDAGVRIGNFSTDLGVQTVSDSALRLFVAVRGDPSVTWIDYDIGSSELSCGDGAESVPLCNGKNRLLYMRDDVDVPLSSEPFGVYVDSENEYVLVSHLAFSAVSLVHAPRDGDPVLADRLTGLFEANPNTGVSGAVGVAGRQPGTEGDLVYVTSRSDDRVQMVYAFTPASPADGRPVLLPSEHFFLDTVTASDDSRGIAINDDGTRAYILNRDPPSLQIIDTSLDEFGFPRNTMAGVVEICRDAANLTVADLGRGERVYVTCFTGGQVWVVDPRAEIVEATITVGRGPHALALVRDDNGAPAQPRLYVGNFLEDTIAVVDVTPGAATENRMVMRLGKTRQSGDDN